MARRRLFRPYERTPRGPRVNERIRISPLRLIDENDEMVGVVELEAALRLAREAGLDLVEISSTATPPVVRIMDFGKWKYEQSKKDKASKAKSKTTDLKEVRLGRSMKIDPHDIGIRLDQARRFLIEGHKVQIVQNFRGREMLHRERGHQRMREIMEQLADVAKVEVPPRQLGRRMTMIFAPDRAKIDQLKRNQAALDASSTSDSAEAATAETSEPERLHAKNA
ncbi:MAG: translation initiation factor IF-3 [Planctomycetota bacterium]|nr:translation initiation factor IF-3 [Planctomycetota bacterium]MCZ6734762.1 translation initiation factor IF-3 [Planctomycetota bacterium]MCZ6850103.1 translation initiation factor IF-3 [Planctomycetota bacterium]